MQCELYAHGHLMYYCATHVQLLLEHNGDVNSVDASGNSPLHCLCSEKKSIANLTNCISLLVSTTNSYTMETNVMHINLLYMYLQTAQNNVVRYYRRSNTAIATLSLTHVYVAVTNEATVA